MLLDARAGHEAKEQGMQLALDFCGDWRDRVVLAFTAWAATQKAMGLKTCPIEQFRAATSVQPDSHKAWGSLPSILCRAGLIAPDLDADGEQRTRRAAAPKTHARRVGVWRLL